MPDGVGDTWDCGCIGNLNQLTITVMKVVYIFKLKKLNK
jgi:hypothetical protein